MRERLVAFYHEVRRRKVGTVLILYAAAGWPVIEFSKFILETLGFVGLDLWILILWMIGGPIALVLAWVYDITPQGLVRTPDLREPGLRGSPPGTVAAARTAPPGSIAVLPFVAIGGGDEAETFGDGLTEELISALAHLSGLRVSARTSVFSLRGSNLDAREIGRKLMVARLVEGSVRLSGARLRLNVQLVDTDDGGTLWSDVFDRDTSDVFVLQEQLARAIADELHLKIEDDSVLRRARHAPSDQAAHVAYAKGRSHWNRRTEADLRTAIGFFKEAIGLAPEFALAQTGLADTHAILLDYGFDPPVEALPRLKTAAAEAVRLAPDLGEAQTSWALACQFSWQWQDAETAFRRALALAPSYAVARQRFALFLAWLGRSEEALLHIEEAERLDPLSLAVSASVGWIHYYARDYEEARLRLEGPLHQDPSFASALSAMGSTLAESGDLESAIEHHRGAVEASRGSAAALSLLGNVLGRAGRPDEARQVLGQLRDAAGSRYVSSYHLALAELGLGREDEAMALFERAVEERSPNVMYLGVEPIVDPLRGRDDFDGLLGSIGFPKP